MTDPKVEHMPDGRHVIDGISFSLSVITVVTSYAPSLVGNRDVHMTCSRCGVRWSMVVTGAELRKIYERIPPRSSAMTLYGRVPQVRKAVNAWAAGHIYMPRGFVSIPMDILSRVNPKSSKAEQYDTLATVIAELAIKEGA